VVEEEAAPDPEFAGLPGPNPELPEAWVRSLERAQQLKPDLIVATDGDGDRIGVAIPDGNGGYRVLTGNQIGTLALYYLCLRRQPVWTGSEFACASIVSSPLARKIIEGFGGRFHETLTGFKWMGNLMERKEAEGAFPVMAYEEAFGMSFGGARDKDGVTGVALFAEIAGWCASQGLTMDDLLDRLFVRYGIHLEQGAERFYEGAEGVDIMRERMGRLRRVPPVDLAGSPVTEILDVAQRTRMCGGETTPVTHLPRQDLFMVRAADGSWMALRPSGTEPKIKAYLGVVVPTSGQRLKEDKAAARNRLNEITSWAEEQVFG
jgi:phosphoglucomutase